jgi:hypothetical protein
VITKLDGAQHKIEAVLDEGNRQHANDVVVRAGAQEPRAQGRRARDRQRLRSLSLCADGGTQAPSAHLLGDANWGWRGCPLHQETAGLLGRLRSAGRLPTPVARPFRFAGPKQRRARGWACFCPRSEPAVSHGQTGSIEAAAISPIRQRGHGDTRCRRGQTPRPGAPRTWLVRLPKESRVARRRLLTTDLPSSRLADDWPPPNGPASHRGSRPRFHLKGIHAHGTLCPRGLTPKEE